MRKWIRIAAGLFLAVAAALPVGLLASQTWVQQGRSLFEAQKYDQAIQAFTKALAHDQSDTQAAFNRLLYGPVAGEFQR